MLFGNNGSYAPCHPKIKIQKINIFGKVMHALPECLMNLLYVYVYLPLSSVLVINSWGLGALQNLQVIRVAESFRIFSTIAVSMFDTSQAAGFYLLPFQLIFLRFFYDFFCFY